MPFVCAICCRTKLLFCGAIGRRVSVDNKQQACVCGNLCSDYCELPCARWGVLFSHPADYTPVCTTELGVVASLIPEFEKRKVKVIALSCDPVETHKGWIKDIQVPLDGRAERVESHFIGVSTSTLCKLTLPHL